MTPVINSLAVVLPRYGESIGGGAETLVKSLVEQIYILDGLSTIYLKLQSERGDDGIDDTLAVRRLEVWTTCAKDHRTWENELQAGKSVENGIVVRRFPVDARDLNTFIHFELAMRDGKILTADEQLDWLENSVNSTALYQHIVSNGEDFDAILFAPYLFATSFWGALIYPERSIIIPCLHDEHYAYQGVFQYLFNTVRGLIFNSEAERDLAKQLYQLSDIDRRSAVVGMGFDIEQLSDSIAQSSANVPRAIESPYLLYVGRKEEGKNLDLLIEAFAYYKGLQTDDSLKLVIVGSGEISFLDQLPKDVIDLGFASEKEKLALMREAVALCQPSVNESFSIVMMESWLVGTPVIVHANCSVTREHSVNSGGGLYFADVTEFAAVVGELTKKPALRNTLAQSGRSYVIENYSWAVVMKRLSEAFELFFVNGQNLSSLSKSVACDENQDKLNTGGSGQAS